jgi:uncharacterized protein YqjF (DUF2071 family)
VLGARTFFHLPYFNADIDLEQDGTRIDYSLTRTEDPAADFDASWKIGDTIPYSHPGSLEFFLTERYCLYSEDDGELYRARIHHSPWPLQKADLHSFSSSMIESHGLSAPQGDPLLHYCEELDVKIWPLESVDKG